MKPSWRTTLAGIGAIVSAVGGFGVAIKLLLDGDISGALAACTAAVGGISAGIGLMKARDEKVSTEAVVAAGIPVDEAK